MTAARDPNAGRVILLDVMGTLVYDPFYREIPAFFGMSLEQLITEKDPHAWLYFEKGQIDEAELLRDFFADRRPFDHEGLKECMRSAFEWLDGMRELVAGLAAAGHELHALSNYAPWYSWIEEKLGLSEYLRWSFVSCDTGLRKPDPKAFTGAAAALGVPPAECLFVDDRRGNVEAADAVGMNAVLFQSADQLALELKRRGILG